MDTNATPPAKGEFCVWADYVRRMYQHVEADSPQEAYRIAERDGGWEPCDLTERNCYRLSTEVQDLATEEFVRIDGGATDCKACGSAIVETVNAGTFRDGECDACEYERYEREPHLRRLLGELLDATLSRDLACGGELTELERNLRSRVLAALPEPHGIDA